MKESRFSQVLLALVLAGLLLPGVALADDEETGWSDTAEFSYVVTAGNSESQTLGFKNLLARVWESATFELKASAIRAETTDILSRAAFGTPASFVVQETSETRTSAANYMLDGRYNHDITDTFFWYVGLGWERNRPAGIDNRYVTSAGVGNIWKDEEDLKFRTDYAITFTDQEDVNPVPGASDSFTGARVSWKYLNKLGSNTTYTNTLVVDGNFDETDDFRADMVNSVAVAMNERMALKVSLQWLYDNMPSFTTAPLFDMMGPGGVQTGTVPVELDQLDTVFTSSLVVNF